MILRGCEVEYIADGTRYRLLVVVDSAGGLIVTWPDARWGAWCSEHVGGEIRPWKGGASAVDLANIGRALDHVRRQLAASPEKNDRVQLTLVNREGGR